MKILQIHNKYLEKGGEDTVVVNERQLLQQYGYEVDLCEFDNIHLEGISKISLLSKTFFNIEAYKKVLRHIEIFKPDIIHIHNVFYEASPSVFWAIKKKNIPAVMTLHNYRFGCIQGLLFRDDLACQLCLEKKSIFYGLKYKCFKGSYIKSLQLSLVNKFHQWTLRHKNPVKKYLFLAEFNRNLLSPVLSGADIEGVIKPNYVEDWGHTTMAERDEFYLYVGRLNEQKGLKILIDSFKKNNLKIEIIGNGPLEEYALQVSSSYPNIRYLGYANNTFIIEKLKKCKALIVPSLTYEGQPMTILEAFSTGTPVLASNIKNLDTIVAEGKTGYLFEPYQIGETIQFFDTMDISKKKNFYKNARLEFEKKYAPNINYAQLMNIYASVLNADVGNNKNVNKIPYSVGV